MSYLSLLFPRDARKPTPTLLLFPLLCTCALALDLNPLSAQTITVGCDEMILDSGGANGNYSNDENFTYNLCPANPGDVITAQFGAIVLEDCCDFLTVYDGVGTGSFIAENPASNSSYTSTDAGGCLTITFQSDGSITEPGFTFSTTCTPAPTCPAPRNIRQTAAGETTITIELDETGTATVYDIYLAAAGAPLPASPSAEDVTIPFTFTGLAGNTEYDVWVRADCDAGADNDESSIVGPTNVSTTPGQPANDDCANAILVPVQDFESLCDFSTEFPDAFATNSPIVGNDCSFQGAEDTWISFQPISSGVKITVVDNTPFGEGGDRNYEVFSGTCGNLTSLGCGQRIGNLTAGQTYLVRILSSNFGGEPNASYSVCIQGFAPPPPNDDCEDAIDLAVSPDVTCLTSTSGTTVGARQSFPRTSNCTGSPDDDVWYSFTATGPAHLLYLFNVESAGGTFDRDLNYEVYSGDCTNRVTVVCDRFNSFDDPPVAMAGLTAGEDYLVRIYTNSSSSLVNFDICIGSPPVNDACAGAIEIPINPTAECDQIVTGSTVGSTVAPGTPVCENSTNNGDVWFRFTATRETHLLSVPMIEEANGGRFIDLFGQLIAVDCDGQVGDCLFLTFRQPFELSDLTVGQEYFLRVFTRRFTTQANFDLCLASPPPNDECEDAITAVVNPDLTNTLTTAGTSFGATQSFEIDQADSGCSAFANDDDVWYQFTALSNEHRVSLLNVVPRSTGGLSPDETNIVRIYGGGCGNLTELDCDFLRENADEAIFSGLTPREVYFLSVQSLGTRNDIEFELSIKTEEVIDLPVELLSFTGKAMPKHNLLEWSVALEENFSHYEVQQSPDGHTAWRVIDRVSGAAAGAGSGTREYTAIDEDRPAEAFYRIRSVDVDGTFAFSDLVHISRASAIVGLTVIPNPSNGDFRVALPGLDAQATLSIYSIQGSLLWHGTTTSARPKLPAGVYQLRLVSRGEAYSARAVVR